MPIEVPVPESVFLSSVSTDGVEDLDDSGPTDPRPSPLEFPCKVTTITVQGNKRIRKDLILQEVQDAKNATTHEELADELMRVQRRLHDLDAFRHTECTVDVGDGDNEVEAVTVSVGVEEEGRHALAYGVLVVEGEGSVQTAWAYRDDEFNNAQQVRAAVSFGHRQSNGMLLEMIHPFITGAHHLRLHMFDATKCFSTPSRSSEQRRGMTVRVEDARGPNTFSYNLLARSLTNMGSEEGLSYKSSFAHSYSLLRSTPNWSCKLVNAAEVAGLPLCTDNAFWRNHTEAQAQYSSGRFAASFFASLGLIQVGGSKQSHMCDRFFLGGPLSFRGFRTRGVGERVSRDLDKPNAGGDAMFLVGGSVSYRLKVAHSVTAIADSRLHAFANLGNVAQKPRGMSVFGAIPSLFSRPRASAGFGVVFPTALGRLELNLCFPIAAYPEEGDRTARWQLALDTD